MSIHIYDDDDVSTLLDAQSRASNVWWVLAGRPIDCCVFGTRFHVLDAANVHTWIIALQRRRRAYLGSPREVYYCNRLHYHLCAHAQC
ncbi:unnamed protein product [Periconia digitata]|uniref:Uncharacterized protein n=1 Tax=Periconia digitata TaxID=1303443 RepID=A0A9W4XPG0_9PLEO|nr:unnamed protein product [Periconia digitata]